MPRHPRRRTSNARLETMETRRLLALAVVNANSGNTGPGEDSAFAYDVTADGRYAVYISRGENNVASPPVDNQQVYRRNLSTGVNELVSFNAGKTAGAGRPVLRAKMSADGRYIAFSTNATDITSGDANNEQDTYVRDMKTGTTTLVSRGYVGVLADKILGAVGGDLVAISPDGKYVAFGGSVSPDRFVDGATDTNSTTDLYIWNRDTKQIKCVSFRNGTKQTGNRSTDTDGLWGDTKFSQDGRYLMYYSRSSNLVSGVTDGSVSGFDVFLYDTTTGLSECVSTTAAGTTSGNNDSAYADLSNDGRYVVYETLATNLVTGDTNGFSDVLMKDRSTGAVTIISRKNGGGVANNESTEPDITGDGRYVAYSSVATNIASPDNGPGTISDVYRFDTTNNTSVLVSKNTAGNGPGGEESSGAKISNDGNFVAFTSAASNIASNATKNEQINTQVFVRDILAGTTRMISVGPSNVAAEADSLGAIFSQDGSRILFKSSVSNLVTGDTNATEDVFTIETPGNDFAVLKNGSLQIRGSYLSDTIVLNVKSGKLNVVRNGITLKFTASAVTSIGIDAKEGDDTVVLGAGIIGSYVLGGSGNDNLTGGAANDNMLGAAGNDTIVGGLGNDRIDGGKGNDTVNGNDGDDRLYGGDGNDSIVGEGGVDRLWGDAGKDTMDGGSSNDKFYANDGAVDVIFGGKGTDLATIDASKDILNSVENTN